MLDFYRIQSNYISFLQEEEKKARGFTRVPNLTNPRYNKDKFMCGIVLEINHINYYVPVSSYKKKKSNNILILRKDGTTLGSLRFNYMIPIPLSEVELIVIKNEKDFKYKSLLSQEFLFVKSNEEKILSKAKSTYKKVLCGKDLGLVFNSCDFKLLEQKCKEWEESRR